MTKALITWGPAAIWAAVLFLLSESQPDPDSVWLTINDKVAHVVIYTVLGGTLAWGEWRTGRRLTLLLLFIGLGYGVFDEWHQSFVPGRDSSIGDAFADVLGVVLGIFLLRLYFRARGSRLKGEHERTT